MLSRPATLDAVRADRDLVPEAIEEALRWETPALSVARAAAGDVELGGVRIPAGALVAVSLGAANRDPRRYENPDVYDIHRADTQHLTFGYGLHFCLGANLARMELRLIFTEIVTRLDDLALDGPVEALRSNFVGGIKHMPVRWTPAEVAVAR